MIGSFILRGIDWRAGLVIVGLLVVGIGVPLSVDSPGSPFYLTTNDTLLYGKYLCYALLALSIGLIWGYGGILSLGHGAFFAIGGYAMGMYLMRAIGTRGVYGNPILPDFMVFLNWSELPWFWHGFDQFWFAAIMIVLIPGALAFLFGWFAFRSRVTGVYLSIITQALTYALYLLFLRNETAVGGNNGFTDFKDILGVPIGAPDTRGWLFGASAIALAIGYWICRSVIFSKYGKVIVAIRDAESRTRFLGYRVDRYKTFLFTLSACMAGVAGALYVPQVGIINPGELSPLKSIEAVVWVAVGGRGTLVGPMLGGVLVNAFKTYFTGGASQPYWVIAILPALGLLFLLIIYRASLGWVKVVAGAAAGAAIAALGLVWSDTWAFPSPDVRFVGGLLSAESWGWTVAAVAIIAWLVLNKNKYVAGAIFGAFLCRLLVEPAEMLALAPNWPYFLGALFIGVTLLLPRGIVGTISFGWNAWRARRASIDAQEGRAADLTDPEPPRMALEAAAKDAAAPETANPPPGAVAQQASS